MTLATPPRPAAVERPAGRTGSRPLLLQGLAVLAVYRLYAWARNEHGAASAQAWETARRNADGVVAVQDALHLPSERALQQLVLGQEWLVRSSGAYYGTAHFMITLAVLVALVVRRSPALARLGATLALSTFVAVGVFALYPVAPPRLMPDGERTVDTLATFGGLWSYDHGVLERISDPFAAMPSLHLGWATWCALALWVLAERSRHQRAWRAAALAHPILTLVSVLVTGNHWYLDAVAGTALVLVVAGLQTAVRRRVRSRTYAPVP